MATEGLRTELLRVRERPEMGSADLDGSDLTLCLFSF